MACSCDDIQLLLPGQIDELDSVSGYADREVRILRLLGMLHCVNQFLCAEYIDVEVVSAAVEISVHDIHQGRLLLIHIVAERDRADRLCVGDAV